MAAKMNPSTIPVGMATAQAGVSVLPARTWAARGPSGSQTSLGTPRRPHRGGTGAPARPKSPKSRGPSNQCQIKPVAASSHP